MLELSSSVRYDGNFVTVLAASGYRFQASCMGFGRPYCSGVLIASFTTSNAFERYLVITMNICRVYAGLKPVTRTSEKKKTNNTLRMVNAYRGPPENAEPEPTIIDTFACTSVIVETTPDRSLHRPNGNHLPNTKIIRTTC